MGVTGVQACALPIYPTAEPLSRLNPASPQDGTITAGTASQISDGACAVVVMSAEKAAELGITPIAEIGAHGVVAGPDATLQSQPSRAVQRACEREGIDPKELDLVEFNEAFAAVALVSTKELGIDPEKVNPNGGRSEEHTSELQSRQYLVCRLLLE